MKPKQPSLFGSENAYGEVAPAPSLAEAKAQGEVGMAQAQQRAETADLRREQDKDLRELEKVRREMESEIEAELTGTTKTKWNGRTPRKMVKKATK